MLGVWGMADGEFDSLIIETRRAIRRSRVVLNNTDQLLEQLIRVRAFLSCQIAVPEENRESGEDGRQLSTTTFRNSG